mgnify:CR=1 FL=1
MLADDPAELAQFGGLIEIRPIFHTMSPVAFSMIRMMLASRQSMMMLSGWKRLSPASYHLFGPSTDMELMCIQSPMPSGLRLAVVGVAGEGVLGAFAEAHFVEMFVAVPFPHDVAVPVHFEDHVVEKLLVGNLGIAGVAVREHKRIAGVGLGLHAGRVVAGGAAFALES